MFGQQGCDADTEFECSREVTDGVPSCIPLNKVNDSVNDCGDNSDEGNVPCSLASLPGLERSNTSFLWKNVK